MTFFSSTAPTVAQKYSRAHRCCPQYRLRKCGNSLQSPQRLPFHVHPKNNRSEKYPPTLSTYAVDMTNLVNYAIIAA
jgi:hypothetical protein